MSAHEQIMAGVKVTITIPAYCTNAELWEILMAAYDKELDRILVENPTPITDPARLLGPGVVDVVQFRDKIVILTGPLPAPTTWTPKVFNNGPEYDFSPEPETAE